MTNSTPRTIKKYENRRLYDTGSSRYINLEGVAELVRSGEDIVVVESKSGNDVTRQVLTQIIVEGSREQDGPPIPFLRDLIRTGDKSHRDFLHWYLSGANEVWERARSMWEERPKSRRSSQWDDWNRLWSPAQTAQRLAQFWGLPGTPPARSEEVAPEPDPEPVPHDQGQEIGELRSRLEELERRLDKA